MNAKRLVALVAFLAPLAVAGTFGSFTEVCSQTNSVVESCVVHDVAGPSQATLDEAVGAGQFTGSAVANNAAPGSIGVSTNVAVSNYAVTSNVFFAGSTADNTARAEASWRDTLSIAGVLPATFDLTLEYSLDGSFSSNSAWISSRLYDLTALFDDPLVGGSSAYPGSAPLFWRSTDPAPPATISRTFTGLSADSYTLIFSMLVTTDIPRLTDAQVPTFTGVNITGEGGAHFGTTATITSLLITGPGGVPVNGVTVTGTNGFAYPMSSLNAVPEPATGPLVAVAGALLLAVAWWRRSHAVPMR